MWTWPPEDDAPDPDSEDEQWLGTKGAAEGKCRVLDLRRQEVELIEVHLEEAITDLAKAAWAAESAYDSSDSNASRQKATHFIMMMCSGAK